MRTITVVAATREDAMKAAQEVWKKLDPYESPFITERGQTLDSLGNTVFKVEVSTHGLD